jgi:hypothetical protein
MPAAVSCSSAYRRYQHGHRSMQLGAVQDVVTSM